MRRPSRHLSALLAITVSGAFINGASAEASGRSSRFQAAAPQGFEALAAERDVVLDAYFGGRKVGEVAARIGPGTVRFADPGEIAGLIPDAADKADLARMLSGPLDSHAARACGLSRIEGCGMLEPGAFGVVVDEDRFRVDIFVSPDLLARPDPAELLYLPAPDPEPSLISLFGVTASGSSRGGETLHFQNRLVASAGAARLRSDSSVSTDTSLTIDNLTLEADRGDWRYLGGIFWAPGSELIGRRRIAGLGAATQLDTRQNRDMLLGTPVSVFLQQPAKVDLMVDGRIISSRIHPAGNRLIDTSALPNGSYDLVVRIQEDGRPPREVRRFFTKGSAMAPAGRPLFSAFAGFLPASGRGLKFHRGSLFYQASAAYRLSPALGVDASLFGTRRKAIVEAGATYHMTRAQVRLAGLVSSSADYGAVLRLSSLANGPLSYSFDLRKVVSNDGRALLPVARSRGTFSQDPQSGFSDRGSYTQALSVIGYRLGEANLRLTGLYRRNGSERANYSIGAAIDLPVVRTGRWDILLQADGRHTDRDYGAFLGARFLINKGNLAFSGSGGLSHQSGRPGSDSQPVGELQAGLSLERPDYGRLAADVAAGRSPDGAYARASASARTSVVNARADLLQQFGENRTTQYAATIDGGLALSRAGAGFAGRNINDSAVMVRASGEEGHRFDVLVDEAALGTVGTGEQLLLFLSPYQTYDIRLRPRGEGLAKLDAATRQVTPYPGNVAMLEWQVTPLFILFGRAVGADGRPIPNADVSGPHGIGRTDDQGYFQIESNGRDRVRLTHSGGTGCTLEAVPAKPVQGLVSAGDLLCR